jgi:hypothetical protein
MIYIIYDSRVFSFTAFLVKLLCCVLLIFHFVHCGCDRGLIASAISNSRSDSVFNKWRKLLDQDNGRNTLICIEISTWYQGHGGHGVTEVRCEHNFILPGLTSSRVRTLVLKTSGVFRNKNSLTLDKGRV